MTLKVADQVNAIGRMDSIVHNAGIYTRPERGATSEGHAVTLAVNSLAPYILTALVERPERLIYLSSGLHRGGEGSLADIDWTRRRWNGAQAYAESKLHVATLALALARRWPGTYCNAVDPGWVPTKMGGRSAPDDLQKGYETQVGLAASDDSRAKVSGRYFHHKKVTAHNPLADDVKLQEKFLNLCAEITGVQWPG